MVLRWVNVRRCPTQSAPGGTRYILVGKAPRIDLQARGATLSLSALWVAAGLLDGLWRIRISSRATAISGSSEPMANEEDFN
jgi:hypothetical protein